ncbi:MAG: hypothetical protein ABIE23_03210 [archaeon]
MEKSKVSNSVGIERKGGEKNEKINKELSLLDKVLGFELMKKGAVNLIVVFVLLYVFFVYVMKINLVISYVVAIAIALILAYSNDWL